MKKLMVFIFMGLTVFLISGCASLGERFSSQINYIIPKSQVTPGEVLQLTVVLPKGVKKGSVRFLDRKYSFYPRFDMEERTYTAYMPIPGKVKPGQYIIHVYLPYYQMKDKPPISEAFAIQILPDYTKRIDHHSRSGKFDPKKLADERKIIQQLLAKSTYKPDKLRDLLLPLSGRVVSSYSTFRTYKKKYEIPLKGLEIIPVATGTLEVNSAAEGKVVMAKRLSMLGRCVLIDHGRSFMTLYCHLASISVKKGDKVERGTKIGIVGRSGYAAVGRRLYYQLFVAGIPIDIERFVDLDIFH